MSDPKPLPCPFCGAEPDVWQDRRGEVVRWRVGCGNEDCHIIPNVLDGMETEAEAVSRWNRRREADK